MIILDFETNSQNIGDVIEVAAVKLKKIDGVYKIIDKFHRYYLSRYSVNPYSYEVHKLTPELILEHRKDKEYASYFTEDLDFVDFCDDCETLVAHNISFELRHLDRMVKFENHFCTMKENKKIVKAVNKNGNIKNPKLDETCVFYKIDFDTVKYHSATYDVSKTYEILKRMQVI
ncbi:3'-5' exonuclease [Poseidonibacter ostreae]|jgi:DNA polymerase III subunit epsilon|uniref:3'-5' exonuclease n=1 Tax=Poseidonibacter ostreae TaxID=2654171 RepID=A0A6L4WPA2_9BACT|nr:3'-5' exonuclease [Poseidonibacter ostreae]KAB7885795.1 3'-5' exonuclease [Poseidonibacter ostreae]KAB7886968.1 3'-5' exonuclease [Poseidonibacter ostreae]KAB7887220.1 3'-5' exonuclease [Poseidonibacter ostreae]